MGLRLRNACHVWTCCHVNDVSMAFYDGAQKKLSGRSTATRRSAADRRKRFGPKSSSSLLLVLVLEKAAQIDEQENEDEEDWKKHSQPLSAVIPPSLTTPLAARTLTAPNGAPRPIFCPFVPILRAFLQAACAGRLHRRAPFSECLPSGPASHRKVLTGCLCLAAGLESRRRTRDRGNPV